MPRQLKGPTGLYTVPLRPCFVLRKGTLRSVRLRSVRRGELFVIVDGPTLIAGVATTSGRERADGRGEIVAQSWQLVKPKKLPPVQKRRAKR